MINLPITKHTFPFRLGTTSYIIPADVIPNVEVLAPCVDDIELVLFESPELSNIPSFEQIKRLRSISLEHDTTYTIHFPIDKKAGSDSQVERTKFCEGAKQIIDNLSCLMPAAWILHLEGIDRFASSDKITDWQKWCFESLDSILTSEIEPKTIAIESLGYPWYWHTNIAAQNGTSLCADVGHLWLYFLDQWREQFIAMLPKTRVIHLHGVANGKDHISLAKSDKKMLIDFLNLIKEHSFNGVITLEIFSEIDLIESVKEIFDLWEP
jgi:sugar phosphate isomerase/epimerase